MTAAINEEVTGLPVLPTINLDQSTAAFGTDEEVEKQIEAGNSSKYFEQGHYELKITGARFNKVCADKNWMSLCITLGTGVEGDDRVTKIYPLIPINMKTEYQKPGGKPTMFCWSQTVNFLKGIGEPSKASTLGKFLSKYLAPQNTKEITYQAFSEEKQEMQDTAGYSYHKLIGKTIEVDLGFEGMYISKIEDTDTYGVYNKGKIVVKGDKELIGDSFDDCLLMMTDHDIEDKLSRLSVTKIYAGKATTAVNSDLEAL